MEKLIKLDTEDEILADLQSKVKILPWGGRKITKFNSFTKTDVGTSSIITHNRNKWIKEINKQWLQPLALSQKVFF